MRARAHTHTHTHTHSHTHTRTHTHTHTHTHNTHCHAHTHTHTHTHTCISTHKAHTSCQFTAQKASPTFQHRLRCFPPLVNRVLRSHECLDNPARKRWVLTGAGIQGSRLVTLARLALLNCSQVSHKYVSNPATKQGGLLEQESKEAGLASPGNPRRSASSNKSQISGQGSHCKADKQAAVSQLKKHAANLIRKPQRSRLGSHSKADKQAPVRQPKKHAVSLISKPQIIGAGSHSKADKQATVSLISKADKHVAIRLISKPQISGEGSHSKADKQVACCFH